jgi:hypothetical protein
MADNRTVFQRLRDVVIGNRSTMTQNLPLQSTSYDMSNQSDNVIYTFQSKEERDTKLIELRQQKLLAYQWAKNGYDTSMQQLAGATQVKVMYRDADLMDMWPEIGKALDIYSEETCCLKNGKMLNIYSKSPRIKSILEDLFENRLDIQQILPEIARGVCKYGNDFRFLNINAEEGVLGWRELPVHEMRRIENGMQNIYGGATVNANLYNIKPGETKFVWEGHNEQMPYLNWQVAHFRMIRNGIYLPYGCSLLNSARRHWRILSMMEDGMLLYRLERSIERRIFKVNVGAIDDADVPAFLQEFANSFKRAPIIDPATGQVDLRKNFLDVSADYFLPVRPGQDPTSIDTLASAQNITSMDDINFIQNKVLTSLGVPKSFLNYQEANGKAQNLSLMDIRFCRAVNYIQQVLLTELNHIAIIHLYTLGFIDDLTNFTLTMNNPSNQIELMELDNLTKRLAAASSALAEQGGGIPLMSWHQVQKEIMGRTDADIAQMLNEIRIEAAIANELQMTGQIIKKTGLFDKADRIYGEPGAKYSDNPEGGEPGGGGGSGLGGGMPMMGGDDFGGDELGDLDSPDSDMSGEIGGDMGSEDMGGSEPLQESKIDEYIRKVLNNGDDYIPYKPKATSEKLFLNENLTAAIKEIDSMKKSFDDNLSKQGF